MPVNSLSETKKVEKTKLSLSLNRNNAKYCSLKNFFKESKENSVPLGTANCENKQQERHLKRPLNCTYYNTLNAAKKLKTSQQESNIQTDSKLVVLKKAQPKSGSAMLNGDHQPDYLYSNGTSTKTPVATLSNLGNTCFLNSVLYTLRYAPRFIHNLHHLVSDLAAVEQKIGCIRLKSSSLGRNAANISMSSIRSFSSKDLLSLGQIDNNVGKTKIQIATEKLHETFSHLRTGETKCMNSSSDTSPEPFAADAFLGALRDVNSIFEGNRQQDAHELLICILNNIRETCRALSTRASTLEFNDNGDSNGFADEMTINGNNRKTILSYLRKSWKKRKKLKPVESDCNVEDRPSTPDEELECNAPGWDFVADDFEGVMVMRTTCLECETVTEHKQAMVDISVPISEDEVLDQVEPFKAAAIAAEYLRDQNKYWCGVCVQYVEARRTVGFSRLPRLLVIQLKRFSGGMTKITKYAPTPLTMPCFCDDCNKLTEHGSKHRYILWAVIMHLGQTLTGGHYVAYARDGTFNDLKCERDSTCDVTTSNGGSSFMKTLFNRPRSSLTGCVAKECCVPRCKEGSWLSCDDEVVKPISNEEFEDLLAAEPKMRSAATPYLLFYVKSDDD